MDTIRCKIRAGQGRRGAALIEFVFSLPLFVLVLTLTFFFGYAMMNQQRVRSADRYAVWRHVHPGGRPEPNEVAPRFFGTQAEDVSIHGRSGPHDTRRELSDTAASYSVEAGEFSDELVVNRFPRGKWKRLYASFPTDVPIWNEFTGAIRSHHARDGVEWRRGQAGLSSTVRDSYLLDLVESLQRIDGTGESLANEIESLIRHGW